MLLTARKHMTEAILELQMEYPLANAYLHQQAGVIIRYYKVQYYTERCSEGIKRRSISRKYFFEGGSGSLAS